MIVLERLAGRSTAQIKQGVDDIAVSNVEILEIKYFRRVNMSFLVQISEKNNRPPSQLGIFQYILSALLLFFFLVFPDRHEML